MRGILGKNRRNPKDDKHKGLYNMGNRQQWASNTRKQGKQERRQMDNGKTHRKRKWN